VHDCASQGGGESLEIFDNPEIAEAALSLSTYFITALGHKDNVPLLQKVADKPLYYSYCIRSLLQ
jgi:exonuclease VII large subunit